MSFYPNRVLCAVLEEMRDQLKKLNHFNLRRYKAMHGMMIEESQTLANRMESGLEDKKDLEKLNKERRKLKKEVKRLKEQIEELKEKAGEESEEKPKSSYDRIFGGDD